MNYSDIKYFDVINGEGVRVSIFASGCTHHCSNCFNQVTWNPNYGKPFTKEVQETIFGYVDKFKNTIKGISLLGGDPTYTTNIIPLTKFVKEFKKRFPTKDVWIWSGYTYEVIKNNKSMFELISNCDVLIDGKFNEELKNLNLKFRGSSNQRVIDIKESIKQNICILRCE